MLMSTNGHRLCPLFFLAWFLPSFLSVFLVFFPTLFISNFIYFQGSVILLSTLFLLCLLVCFLFGLFLFFFIPSPRCFFCCLCKIFCYDSGSLPSHHITAYDITSTCYNLTLSYIILFHFIVGRSLSDWWIGSVCPYQELWQTWRCWVGCYNTERSDQSGERPTHYLFLSLPIFIIFFHFSFLDYWIHYYYLY